MNKKTLALYGAAGLLGLGVLVGPTAAASIGAGGSTTTFTVPGGDITDAPATVDESVIEETPTTETVTVETPENEAPAVVVPVVEAPVEDAAAPVDEEPSAPAAETSETAEPAASADDCDDEDQRGNGKSDTGNNGNGRGHNHNGRHSDGRADDDDADAPSQVSPARPHAPANSQFRGEDAGEHDSGQGKGDGRQR